MATPLRTVHAVLAPTYELFTEVLFALQVLGLDKPDWRRRLEEYARVGGGHVQDNFAFAMIELEAAGQESKAKYPLREGTVQVSEVPGKPGAYRAVAFLRPHFQLDELSVSLRLVAELPQGAGG